jgi:hypothetical protein
MRKVISPVVVVLILLLVSTTPLVANGSPAGPGGVWIHTQAPSGPAAILVYGGRLYAGGNFGLLYSTDQGDSWNPTGLTDTVMALVSYKGKLVADVWPRTGVVISADSGTTWTSMTNGIAADPYVLWANVFFVDGDNLYLGVEGGIFRWTDADGRWTHVGDNQYLDWVMGFCRSGDALYATGYHHPVVSTDDGLTWTPVDRGNFPVVPIYYMAQVGPNLVASAGTGIYYTSSDWNHWHKADTTHGATADILQIGSQVFVSGQGAIYASDQFGPFGKWIGGVDWYEIGRAIADDQNMYIITNHALYRRPLTEIICCQGKRGNVDGTGVIDSADLATMVSYLTGGGVTLPCPEVANVTGTGIIDSADLSAMVSYLTGGGYVLPNCQ